MSQTRPWVVSSIGLILILISWSTPIACDADSVLDVFEANLTSHQTIRLKYDKSANSLLFGERKPESGTLLLGPPKRYRIDTEDQTIVRGEDTIWTYSKSTDQATLRIGALDSLEFGPTGFFGSLRHDFLIVDCAKVNHARKKTWRIRLAAKTVTAAIQRLSLWVDIATLWPVAAEYVDYNEETTNLLFSNYKVDQRKDEKRFHFDIPKDAEVIVLPTRSASASTPDEN